MPTIPNKWIEKQRKKKELATAAAYASDPYDILDSDKKPTSRSTMSLQATMVKTLRGVRK
jgi:hypothetical protein